MKKINKYALALFATFALVVQGGVAASSQELDSTGSISSYNVDEHASEPEAQAGLILIADSLLDGEQESEIIDVFQFSESISVRVIGEKRFVYSVSSADDYSITESDFRALAGLPFVVELYWDLIIERPSPIPSAPQLGPLTIDPYSWALDRIDDHLPELDQTYSTQLDGTGVDIYIVDNGVRDDHQVFDDGSGNSRVTQFYDHYDDGLEYCSDTHGTHVAGLAGGLGIGPATGANIYSVMISEQSSDLSDASGVCEDGFTYGALYEGLYEIYSELFDHGRPTVVNMSLGFDVNSDNQAVLGLIEDVIEWIMDEGGTVVVASGNENQDACNTFPARIPEVISVNAAFANGYNNATANPNNLDDGRSSFSNYGSCTDIFAPGENVRSAINDSTSSYANFSGTSMASPMVAGAAAMVLQMYPNMTPAQVKSLLLDLATDVSFDKSSEGDAGKYLYVPRPYPRNPQATLAEGLFGGRATWDLDNQQSAFSVGMVESALLDSSNNWITSCYAAPDEKSCDFDALTLANQFPPIDGGQYNIEGDYFSTFNPDPDFDQSTSEIRITTEAGSSVSMSADYTDDSTPRFDLSLVGETDWTINYQTATDASGYVDFFLSGLDEQDMFSTGAILASIAIGPEDEPNYIESITMPFTVTPIVINGNPSQVMPGSGSLEIINRNLGPGIDFHPTGYYSASISDPVTIDQPTLVDAKTISVVYTGLADGLSKAISIYKSENSDMSGATMEYRHYGSDWSNSEPNEIYITGDADTQYYIQAIASNDAGTFETSEVTITTGGAAPVADIATASNAGNTSFDLDFDVNPGELETDVEIQYSTDGAFATFDTSSVEWQGDYLDSAQSQSHTLTGLIPGTQYFFRVRAENEIDSNTGSADSVFTTTNPADITNFTVARPTNTTVTVSLDVESDGVATEVVVLSSTEADMSNPTSHLVGNIEAGVLETSSFSATIFGLDPNGDYYFRAQAESVDSLVASSNSSVTSETTTSVAPAITGFSLTGETTSSFQVNFDLNPDGLDTTVELEYSTNSDMSESTTQTVSRTGGINGTETLSFTEQIASLDSSSTFYTRVNATNSQGTSSTGILNIETSSPPPPPRSGGGGGGGGGSSFAAENEELPVITGTNEPGEKLAASRGEWKDPGQLKYNYQWYACEDELTSPTQLQVLLSCDLLSGQTDFIYEVTDKSDKHMVVGVTASLASASSTGITVFSDSVGPASNNGEAVLVQPELPTDEAVESEGSEDTTDQAEPSEAATETGFWTKRNGDNVKLYAKNIIGLGKVQFFVNDEEIAWIRAEDLEDSKLRVITEGPMTGASYLVRDRDLDPGKNVFEIYVDGKREVRRIASK